MRFFAPPPLSHLNQEITRFPFRFMENWIYVGSRGGKYPDLPPGFIKNGSNRIGEIVTAVDLLRNKQIDVEIVSPHFVDPEGEKLRA